MSRRPYTADIKLSREEYREIKGYDKEQMEEYLRQIYSAGESAMREAALDGSFEDGAKQQGAFMLNALSEALRTQFKLDDELVNKFIQSYTETMQSSREMLMGGLTVES